MTLPVDIAITGSTNLQSYELAITYNTAALTLTGVSVGSVGGSWSPSFSADPYNSSIMFVSGANTSPISNVPATPTSTLLDLTFWLIKTSGLWRCLLHR